MLKFRLFIRIIAGILLATLFNATAAESPTTGHFGFQERATAMLTERFVNLRIQLAGGMPNDDDANQAIGLNVYWKTKDKNVLQGRTFDSSLMPNLPRVGKDFDTPTWYRDPGDGPNSENIEMIFFINGFAQRGVIGGDISEAMDLDFGCFPSADAFLTQFYHYRFPGGYQMTKDLGLPGPCGIRGHFNMNKDKEDPDVAMTSFAFTRNQPICNVLNTDTKAAACAGSKGDSSNLLAKDILIPSNKLDFLIIEVITFAYNTENAGRRFQAFPVQVLKFMPSSQKGKMNLSIADGKDPGSDNGLGNTKPNFNMFGASPSRHRTGDGDYGYGFYSWPNSHYYRVYTRQYTEECPNGNSNQWVVNCDYDFTSLDSLTLQLTYANPGRLPSSGSPAESGIAVQLMPTYLDPNCQNDSKNCQYPSRAVGP